MDSILRAIFMYFFLMLIVRVAGNRTLAQMTNFDFVLLLIIGDAAYPAIMGNDNSIISAALSIITFILLNILMTFIKK